MVKEPFITKIEKIETLNDKRSYISIKGLDISNVNSMKTDLTTVRRMLLKQFYKKEGFKCFIVVVIDDVDVTIQVSNQVYQRIAKQIPHRNYYI